MGKTSQHDRQPIEWTRDEQFMKLAIEQARRAEGRTSPNPMVGVVVVRDDEVIATGFHTQAGMPHAEREAVLQAGEASRGAEVFVNLEPCCHYGRTSPCTDALIEAGVRRVVVGVMDPNPLVSGKGLTALREAGIEVCCGVLQAECERLNAAFFKYIQTNMPYVVAKYAMTLDGKIATRTGDSRWISNELSRHRVHEWRNRCNAVLIGKNTLIRDDPSLTTRGVDGGRDAVRVVLDGRGVIGPEATVLNQQSDAPTWVVCSPEVAGRVRAFLGPRDSVIEIALDDSGRIPLLDLLHRLGERQIMSLLVEGGSEVLGGFFDQDLIDEVVIFLGPTLIGGAQAITPIGGRGVAEISEAAALQDITIEVLGTDVMVTGTLHPPMSRGC